jgi:hypothetical protein
MDLLVWIIIYGVIALEVAAAAAVSYFIYWIYKRYSR